MAKIAVALERALERRAASGTPGQAAARLLAEGEGWSVSDVICTSGPRDRPFEERHSRVSIAIVLSGTFQYRSAAGRELMTPGSLMLGNPGQCFECGHEHGHGDRCLSFSFDPDYVRTDFRMLRIPPVRELSSLVTKACAGLCGNGIVAWDELGVEVAARTAQLTGSSSDAPTHAMARVTRAVRAIEQNPDAALTLGAMAREAGLSPYYFLRTFEQVTGVTPHQYILRVRLREAALRLIEEPSKILDIALNCGFGDISNFNRAFRREFGVSPRAYRGVKQ